MICISCISNETGSRFRPDANFVILISQVLNTFKVERFDDPIIAKIILAATSRSLNSRIFRAINLRNPYAEFVGFCTMYGSNGKIDVFEMTEFAQMNVEMLIWVDSAKSTKTHWPNCTRYKQILFITYSVVR